MQKMTPFQWFDGDIAAVVEFYRSVVPAAKVVSGEIW